MTGSFEVLGLEGTVDVGLPDGGEESLPQQYLEATKERASLMDEETPGQAIETEGKRGDGLRAQKGLRQIDQQLKEIVFEYAATTGGRRK